MPTMNRNFWQRKVAVLLARLFRFPPFRWIRTSLSVRVVITLLLAISVIMALLFTYVVINVRDGLFDKKLEQVLADASIQSEVIQRSFDVSEVDNVTAFQDLAYTVLSNQRDNSRGTGQIGVMLSAGNVDSAVKINEIADEGIRPLVSEELKEKVSRSNGLFWQSVAIKSKQGEEVPGIIVGTKCQFPLIGEGELFMLYSLVNEQYTIQYIQRIFLVGITILLLVLVVIVAGITYNMLLPVQRISEAARQISQGSVQARVAVKGEDELAQLSSSFNHMADTLEAQIEDYQKLATLQQRFVSDVSHELRTPLSSIRIATDLLEADKDELPAELARPVEILHKQVGRFDRMLSDLLEISRIDANTARLQCSENDLIQTVQEVIGANTELAEKLGVEIKLELNGHSSCVGEYDRVRVERIIRNLLVNAIEYAEAKPVTLRVCQSENTIALQVIDRGIGMTDEVARHVFDRFYRADPSRQRTTGGTGLGLAISAEDAALHGGVLTVLSCPGFGSAFLLLLPRIPGAEITEIPSEIDNDELIKARQEWAIEHPEDLELNIAREDIELIEVTPQSYPGAKPVELGEKSGANSDSISNDKTENEEQNAPV